MGRGPGVEEGKGGTDWDIKIDIYALPYVKEIASGNLQYNTESSPRGSVMTQSWGDRGGAWKGGSRGRGYMYLDG